MESWKKYQKEWVFKLWSSDTQQSFIAENYPMYVDKYLSLPSEIQKIDTARYLILLKTGGVFIDLDFQCLKSIEPLISADFDYFLGREPDEHCVGTQQTLILSNAFMAARPNSSFANRILDSLFLNLDKKDKDLTNVMETTGPFFLTSVFLNYKRKSDIRILEPETIFPLTKSEIYGALTKGGFESKTVDAYAVHFFEGTWWRENKSEGPWSRFSY